MNTVSQNKWVESFRGPWLHAGLLFIFALVLRLSHLDRMGFWVDEVATVQHVSFPIGNFSKNALFFTNPPLFHYLVRPFYLFFGRDDFWLRFPCALIGAATVPVCYFILRRLLSARAGLIGACFLMLSPFHIWYSQEFRMYTLVALESFVSLYLWVRAKETDSTRIWLGYAFVSVMGLYTHYWFLFFFASQLLWLMFEYWKGRRFADRNLLILLLVPLSFVPWIPVMIRQVFEDDYSFLNPVTWADLGRVFQTFVFGFGYPFGSWHVSSASAAMKLLVYFVPLLLPVLGAFWPGSQRRRFAEIYIVGLLIPLAGAFLFSYFVTPVFFPRYAMVLFPAYILSMSRLAEIRYWLFRRQFVFVAMAWVASSGVSLGNHYFEMDKAVGKQLWARIGREPRPFRVCTEYLDLADRYSLIYYAGQDIRRLWQIDRVPPRRALANARFDLIVPIPKARSKDAHLPADWSIKSRWMINQIEVVRLAKEPV